VAKASEGGSLVTLRPAGRGRGRDSGWESDQDSGMAAALAASLRETEPMVRTKLCSTSGEGSKTRCFTDLTCSPHPNHQC